MTVNPDAAGVDAEEIAKFERIAEEWWDPFGKFKPLHKFNPVRLGYIRDRISEHFGRERTNSAPLADLRLLDVGCGGGLVAEPMRRLGAAVTAVDASARNIQVARIHAESQGLDIDYRAGTVEILGDAIARGDDEPFDVVLNLEIIEHVPDVSAFIAASARLLSPNGLMITATLNRTLKSLALAKIGAEYILRWLPVGAHDWRKFVTPAELRRALAAAGLAPSAETGLSYNPLFDNWTLSQDMAVNYMIAAART